MRSEKHPTLYRVGSLGESDVYWHPQTGYALERKLDDGYSYLVELHDLSEVDWFDRSEDLDKIVGDLGVSNGQLATAMVGNLYDHILDSIQDAAIAEEGEKEKEATLRQGSGVY